MCAIAPGKDRLTAAVPVDFMNGGNGYGAGYIYIPNGGGISQVKGNRSIGFGNRYCETPGGRGVAGSGTGRRKIGIQQPQRVIDFGSDLHIAVGFRGCQKYIIDQI